MQGKNLIFEELLSFQQKALYFLAASGNLKYCTLNMLQFVLRLVIVLTVHAFGKFHNVLFKVFSYWQIFVFLLMLLFLASTFATQLLLCLTFMTVFDLVIIWNLFSFYSILAVMVYLMIWCAVCAAIIFSIYTIYTINLTQEQRIYLRR